MGVHPNAVTTFGLLVGLGAGALFAMGEPGAANWGAGLFVLAAFVDHVDGEVARFAAKTSTFGHYYDNVATIVTNMAMFIGAGIGLRHGTLGAWAVALGVLAAISVASIMSLRLKIEFDRGAEAVRQGNLLGFEPEDALYLVGPATWLGAMPSFLVAAGIGAPVFLLWVLWQLRKGAAVLAGQRSRS
jgi:phosphatidylglycerophosphate synthase